jgi:peptidoglycan/LPS O-acetylase OafA/YrhL
MDNVRMIAALVVMSGHLLHIKGSDSGFLIGSRFEKILSSGAFAVVVFFGLSGIALRFQTDRYGINTRWLIARIIRLMPVYWVTLLPPIIGCYLLHVKISYPAYGFIVAAVGLQAAASSLSIPPVNGALWSLSVELYLSASLLLLGRWKRNSGFYILAVLIIANLVLPGNAIIQGLPIFYFGYLLPGIYIRLQGNKIFKVVLILIPILILLIVPSFVQGRFQGLINFAVCGLLASLVIIGCQLFASSKKTFWADLSQRSYSLYAVHSPILLFIDKIFFSHNKLTSASQVILTIVAILFATEILYNFIEKPSIKYSRNYLSKHNL